MRYKLIGNELYIARKVVLTDRETKVLNACLTFKEISLDELCRVTKLNAFFTKIIIANINRKAGYFLYINKLGTTKSGGFDIIYKLKVKGED